MKNIKIRKWRVFVNKSWTKKIVFEELFYFKKSAIKKFEELGEKYKNDKKKVVNMLKE